MPTGLDVMAALGNDEAVRLLSAGDRDTGNTRPTWWRPAGVEVARRRPGTRRVRPLAQRAGRLDDVPEGSALPPGDAVAGLGAKQLQTQLGSWAELRHDTILYAKQSYTAGDVRLPGRVRRALSRVLRAGRAVAEEGGGGWER